MWFITCTCIVTCGSLHVHVLLYVVHYMYMYYNMWFITCTYIVTCGSLHVFHYVSSIVSIVVVCTRGGRGRRGTLMTTPNITYYTFNNYS